MSKEDENFIKNLKGIFGSYESELAKLKKQLAIAVEALNWYDGLEKLLVGLEIATGQDKGTAEKALKQIKELDK